MTCETCAHSAFQKTPTGKIKRGIHGACTFYIKLPKLPANAHVKVHRMAIWPDSGDGCETYKLKAKP